MQQHTMRLSLISPVLFSAFILQIGFIIGLKFLYAGRALLRKALVCFSQGSAILDVYSGGNMTVSSFVLFILCYNFSLFPIEIS